jgi:hypothetical protein
MDEARLWPLAAFAVLAVLLGIWPFWWLLKRFGRGVTNRPQPPVAGGMYVAAVLASIIGIAAALAAVSLLAMLQSYRMFTKKTHVAEVQAVEMGPHKMRVFLVPIERDGVRGATEIYDLDGDQFLIGGDVLRFKPFLTALGVETVARLTRVEGHWDSAADANAHKGSAHDRAPPSTAWARLYRGSDRAPISWMVAGAHGNFVSQLPDRRALYDIYVTDKGYVLDKKSL